MAQGGMNFALNHGAPDQTTWHQARRTRNTLAMKRGRRMPMGKPYEKQRHLTSALIDLIIKLPEHEQEALLEALQARQQGQVAQGAPRSALERSGDYASGRYFYWDLFSA
jgi:hypothetical protein